MNFRPMLLKSIFAAVLLFAGVLLASKLYLKYGGLENTTDSNRLSNAASKDGIVWKNVEFKTVFRVERELRDAYPYDVRTDSRGHVYVLDIANHRVLKFDSSGSLLRQWGRRGKGPGEFQMPARLFLDKDGGVIISDWSSGRISFFTPEGQFLRTVKLPGMTQGVGVFSNGNLVVSVLFPQEPFLREYNPDGKLLREFGRHLTPSHLYNQGRLVVDNNDDIYYWYDFLSAILVYSREGKLLRTIDGPVVVKAPDAAYKNPNLTARTDDEIWGTLDVSIDPRYVYVLFSGKRMSLKALVTGPTPDQSDIVHVFQKVDGRYLYSYRLPVVAKHFDVKFPYIHCVVHHPDVRLVKLQVIGIN